MKGEDAQNPGNDAGLERVLGGVLFVGATIASCALGAGLIASFVPALAAASPLFLRAGLVVLMATPIARVAVSTVVYLAERDWLFVALTCTVLVELGAAVIAASYAK